MDSFIGQAFQGSCLSMLGYVSALWFRTLQSPLTHTEKASLIYHDGLWVLAILAMTSAIYATVLFVHKRNNHDSVSS